MQKNKKFLSSFKIENKTVILRVDFDIPRLNQDQEDETKIISIVPTIKKLIDANCKVVILSHMGDPSGEFTDQNSLMNLRFILGKHLERQIKFANATQCANSIKYLEQKDVLLIENLFFHKEEFSKKDEVKDQFVENFATLGDIFVNDAFGVTENLASIGNLQKKLDTYYGIHYEKEIESAKLISESKLKPFTIVIGGNDINGKLEVLKSFKDNVDKVLVGGETGIAFLASNGITTGTHKFSSAILAQIKKIQKDFLKRNIDIILPIDHICLESTNPRELVDINTQIIPSNLTAVDIGPNTLVLFREIIEYSSKIFWNGPMGVFENELSNKATEAIGEYIALSTPKDAYKVASGDSTSLAITMLKIKQKRFNHISNSTSEFILHLK